MVEITDYERRGDLDAPFELTKKAEWAQRQSEQIRDAVRCEVPSLTWEQYVAGEPCPGCGRPYRDEEHWESKGTMYFTDEERARYDAEQERYKRDHPACGSHRHSVSGSLTTHCGKCCPPPPMSPSQRDEIARLLGRPTPPQELMRWRLRLYCGHVVERTAHYTHKTLHAAFMSARACPECGLDPATIVDGEAIGLQAAAPVAGPSGASPKTKRTGKPTKAELEARVLELEAEISRLHKD
ncbi:hypothetical protein B0O41_3912 [Propionibacteriaceae bacterium ES.041]|nr:hypothetical protein B0O41_3912 [Propionibacteriaceae bacterium ES.041]